LEATNLKITKRQEQLGHKLTEGMNFFQQGTEKLIPQYEEYFNCVGK
jgi:hypothetical protein